MADAFGSAQQNGQGGAGLTAPAPPGGDTMTAPEAIPRSLIPMVKQPIDKRQKAFLAIIGVFSALFLVIIGRFLPYVVTGWFPGTPLADHRIHEVALTSTLGLALVGGLLQLRGGDRRPLALWGSLAVIATIFLARAASADLFVPPVIFVALLTAALALHPARDQALRVWRRPRPVLLVLALLALVAAAPYAVEQSNLQRYSGDGDEHAQDGHWSSMAGIALVPGMLVLVGAGGGRGARYPLGGAALIALVLAGISLAYPAAASALGTTEAVAVLVWAAAVVVAASRMVDAGQDAEVAAAESA